jgi:hypothetical protein
MYLVLGEIAIIAEWAEEGNIVKDCEKLVEDAGDAILSWAGFTTKETLSGIVETVTSTSTGDALCAPDSCPDGCSLKKRSRTKPFDEPDPKITGTPLISPKRDPLAARAADPTWGNLNKPASGQLDSWTEDFFDADPFVVTLVTSNDGSSSQYRVWDTDSMLVAVQGLVGCTSVVMVSRCGVYLVSVLPSSMSPSLTDVMQTHHWETWFRSARLGSPTAQNNFVDNILTPLNSANNAQMQGINILPDGYFTTDNNNQVLLYERTLVGSTTPYYPDQVTLMQNYIGNLLSLAPSNIPIQLYSVDQSFTNENTIDYRFAYPSPLSPSPPPSSRLTYPTAMQTAKSWSPSTQTYLATGRELRIRCGVGIWWSMGCW